MLPQMICESQSAILRLSK